MLRLVGVLMLVAGAVLIGWAFNFDVSFAAHSSLLTPLAGAASDPDGAVVNLDLVSQRNMIFDGGAVLVAAGWLTIIATVIGLRPQAKVPPAVGG